MRRAFCRLPLGSMPRLSLVVCCLVLVAAPAAAEEAPAPVAPKEPARHRRPGEAAEAVIEAFEAGDTKTLRVLAARDRPDPWLVADEILFRGKPDAAMAFAKAHPRKAVAKLPAYLASGRGGEADREVRALVGKLRAALLQKQWAKAEAVAPIEADPAASVMRNNFAFGQGLVIGQIPRHEDSARILRAVGDGAVKLGWLVRALSAYHESGLNYYRAGRIGEARTSLRARLRIAEQLGSPARLAGAHSDLGKLESKADKLTQARVHHEAAHANHVAAGSPPEAVSDVLNNLGLCLHYLGRRDEGIARLEEALRLLSGQEQTSRFAVITRNLGLAQSQVGRYDAAARSFEHSIAVFEKLSDHRRQADALSSLGGVRRAQGRYDEALAHHREGLRLSTALKDKGGIARAELDIGRLHRARGAQALALAHLERARSAALEGRDEVRLAETLVTLGSVHGDMRQFEEARALLESAHARATKIGNHHATAESLAALVRLAMAEGDWQRALDRVPPLLSSYRKVGNRAGEAGCLCDLGLIHWNRKNHGEAVRVLRDALRLETDLGRRAGIASVQRNLGGVNADMGNHAAALDAYHAARKALEGTSHGTVRVRVSWGIAESLLALGKFREAADEAMHGARIVLDFGRGLASVESAGTVDTFRGIFQLGMLAALRADDPDRLLAAFELGRAGALRNALGSRKALEAALAPPELVAELEAAQAEEKAALSAARRAQEGQHLLRMRKARERLEAARSRVLGLSRRIERAQLSQARVGFRAPFTLPAIQSRLGSGDALLLLGLTNEEGVALVVTSERARAVALGRSDMMRGIAEAVLTSDGDLPAGAISALKKRVVEPLAFSASVRRVLVSPMGRLGYVPFSMLFPDREVVYVPSGTTFAQLAAVKQQFGQGVLALGAPEYHARVDPEANRLRTGSGERLTALPATRDEVKAVGDVRLLASDATEANLERTLRTRPRWRALHFACHGLIHSDRPMLSSLALTPDESDDGFLTALEILRLEASADLVVMSACRTGRGRIYSTEGILGLTRAFMYVGAPRVLCSLWKVDDEATQALMIRFYELWHPRDGSKGMSAAAALKRAQQHVRSKEQWSDPKYWAAWVLWGLP